MLINNYGTNKKLKEFLEILIKNGYKLEDNIQYERCCWKGQILKCIEIDILDKSINWWSSTYSSSCFFPFPQDKDKILEKLNIKQEKNMNYSYTITDKSVTIFDKNKPYIAKSDHPNFKKIREKLKNEDFAGAIKLFDISKNIETQSKGKITVKNSQVFWKGQPLHNYVTGRILALFREGFNIKPICNFLEDLYNNNPLVKENPNHYLVEDLYKFLEVNNMPLTSDGAFLAWKKTNPDGYDLHSRTIKYELGKIIEESWDSVSKNRGECSGKGLYFGSTAYFDKSGFGNSENNKTFIVKVFPRDVASVPVSYEHSKGRACKLTVYSEYNEDIEKNLTKSVINKFPKRDKLGRFTKSA